MLRQSPGFANLRGRDDGARLLGCSPSRLIRRRLLFARVLLRPGVRTDVTAATLAVLAAALPVRADVPAALPARVLLPPLRTRMPLQHFAPDSYSRSEIL